MKTPVSRRIELSDVAGSVVYQVPRDFEERTRIIERQSWEQKPLVNLKSGHFLGLIKLILSTYVPIPVPISDLLNVEIVLVNCGGKIPELLNVRLICSDI